jgi:hypothetical protein
MAGAEYRAVFVCAHGAGGHKDDKSMLRLARALEPRGFEVVRFNFPYREQGSRRTDSMDVLKASIEKEANKVKSKAKHLILGGRSMGGRAASMLAAEGFACDGLLLAAYPLHPAGKPEKLRDAHLPRIQCPVLCFNGTRDPLCDRTLMEQTLLKLKTNWTLHWIEGADHSFRMLKSSGRTEAQVDAEIGETAARWLAEFGDGARSR